LIQKCLNKRFKRFAEHLIDAAIEALLARQSTRWDETELEDMENETRYKQRLNVVTGAFGFSGKYIARRLLARGERIRTLTNHTDPAAPEFRRIEVAPLDFTDPDQLARNLEGADVLFNTYWVRFAHGLITHEQAVAKSLTLIRAAEAAGIKRIVHVSITNPSLHSPLPYFRGKAEVEAAIRASRLSYAILRPAVLFGTEDILINNIAWLLRRSPAFAIPWGDNRIQPIFADDLAQLAIDFSDRTDNVVIDAVGPETYTYGALVRLIRDTIHSRSLVLRTPPCLVYAASRLLSAIVRDDILTADELRGLMANLLVSPQSPTGTTSLREWLAANAGTVGQHYASELARHYLPNSREGEYRASLSHQHRHAWW
jgi:uncharacterized protein YbjT (DUF2867 family)